MQHGRRLQAAGCHGTDAGADCGDGHALADDKAELSPDVLPNARRADDFQMLDTVLQNFDGTKSAPGRTVFKEVPL
jgi:hypothetical protein